MCDKVEAYARKHAEEYAREEAIRSAIESYNDCGLNKEETLKRIIKRYKLTEEEAEQYYNKVCEESE